MSGPAVLILRVLLALPLYAFLALALWMLTQDIQRTGLGVAGRIIPLIRLEIHTRKRRALYHDSSQADVTLVRDPWCDVPITDKSVSARHARLCFHDGQWWLEDLKSTTGTRLNHQRLSRPTVLTTGHEIKCGQARVVVSVTSGAVPSAILGPNHTHG